MCLLQPRFLDLVLPQTRSYPQGALPRKLGREASLKRRSSTPDAVRTPPIFVSNVESVVPAPQPAPGSTKWIHKKIRPIPLRFAVPRPAWDTVRLVEEYGGKMNPYGD